jgi:mannose-1-phosphate guanylyltransferase/mannose-6-phosphate isomerase-like protein (cupin superfamily)
MNPSNSSNPTPPHVVILAGGSGTRFWPLSRETCPKQMLQIVGEDTLLRQTVKRINGFVPPENIWIVTTEDMSQDIRFHLEPLGPIARSIRMINEPVGRNTAPAIGLAAIYLRHFFPESIMIVMPSDHAIPDHDQFQEDLKLAIKGAEENCLVTFGIKPNRPETGYGYIKIDDQKDARPDGLLKVERFVEKPDVPTAQKYISLGNYYWNSGIFVWKTSRILSEIETHLPSLYKTLKEIESLLFFPDQPNKPNKLNKPNKPNELNKPNEPNKLNKPEVRSALCAMPAHRKTSRFAGPCSRSVGGRYASLEPVSIDYGIMERSSDVLMVPATFRWSDLGSWTALDEIIEKDQDGNILKGNTIDIGSRNTTIFAGERLIATIGLKDMVLVDTPDATLAAPKERVQEIRKIVETLKQKGSEEYLLHKKVERPWGNYTVLEKGSGYKIKRVVINPGAKLSLQLHKKRSEHWVVVSGTAKVTRESETYWVHTNESTFIPVNTKHRLENPGEVPLQIIEVQNGDYLEEDDIERLDDDYGRPTVA